MISDSDLVRYASRLRPAIDHVHATFFEATTAIAFKYFADQKIDVAVVETGLGGRLDATNVLVPEVSVITSIAKDHTQQLGNSLGKIAIEKGGIIKRRRPCVVGAMSRSARAEIERIARQRKAPLVDTSAIWPESGGEISGGTAMSGTLIESTLYGTIRIPLLGDFQSRNAVVAIVAIQALRSRGFAVPERAVRRGFAQLRRLTGIRGRFEIIRRRPLVVLDVGHNPDAVSAIVELLRSFDYRKLILVFGVMKDKDYVLMIRTLASLRPTVFAVEPEMERALPSSIIAKVFRERGCRAFTSASIGDGVRAALRTQGKDDLLLICGSHYVAGEVLRVFRNSKLRKSS